MPSAGVPVSTGFAFRTIGAGSLTAATAAGSPAATTAEAAPAGFIFSGEGGGGNRFLIEAFELKLRNGGFDEALNGADFASFLWGNKGEGIADRSGSTGATDAMYVIIRSHRDIVINDVRNIGDIDAASGDIGGDHDLVLTIFETL